MFEGLSHEIWAAAQLLPDEGVVDGVDRIKKILEDVFGNSIKQLKDEISVLVPKINQAYFDLDVAVEEFKPVIDKLQQLSSSD